MTRRRRVTDRLPLSDAVTKGNLDDRLDAASERMDGHWRLDDERWVAHHAVHDAVAESLRDYKKDANEWRSTLADLRGTFIPKAEFLSEHRALEAKLRGEIQSLAGVVATLDARADTSRDDIKTLAADLKTVAVEKDARRGLLSDTRSLILVVIAVAGFALVILDRLR